MVDDDEVDELDSDSDYDDYDDLDLDDGSEDGEIVEVFPSGNGGAVQKDRFASVSEDEVDDSVFNVRKSAPARQVAGNGSAATSKAHKAEEEEESDSRYGLSKKPTSTWRPRKLTHTSLPRRNDPASDDSDSDDSVVALDRRPLASKDSAKPTKEKKAGSKPKLDPKDRQAFWAAKGQNAVIDFVDSDED